MGRSCCPQNALTAEQTGPGLPLSLRLLSVGPEHSHSTALAKVRLCLPGILLCTPSFPILSLLEPTSRPAVNYLVLWNPWHFISVCHQNRTSTSPISPICFPLKPRQQKANSLGFLPVICEPINNSQDFLAFKTFSAFERARYFLQSKYFKIIFSEIIRTRADF